MGHAREALPEPVLNGFDSKYDERGDSAQKEELVAQQRMHLSL